MQWLVDFFSGIGDTIKTLVEFCVKSMQHSISFFGKITWASGFVMKIFNSFPDWLFFILMDFLVVSVVLQFFGRTNGRD